MRTLLIGIAAASAVITFPAGAQAQSRDSGSSAAVGDIHRDYRDGDRFGHHHGHYGSGENVFVTYGGEWAEYNNRGWDSDSYNDWWHDQPWRSYPRWVQDARQSGTCTPDRMWWSGTGWHC